MKNSLHEIQKLHSNPESSLNTTPQLQKALAKLEASLSREEIQKVTEKSQNK